MLPEYVLSFTLTLLFDNKAFNDISIHTHENSIKITQKSLKNSHSIKKSHPKVSLSIEKH
jgi:hypothetical protein